MKPSVRPNNPCFASGPCAKRPGWTLDGLKDAAVARSHRSGAGKDKLARVIELSRRILGLPPDWRLGIVPGSDTGAFEMAMWSLLGARGVDLFAWDSFGKGWVNDVVHQLKISDARIFEADYGEIPDLSLADPARDIVFVWNGTTSGVAVPDGEWITDEREGLTLCDATSAVFAMDLPWRKLDAVTYSWQKVLGGEAGHGVIILSPRAVERLEGYQPDRPLPKVFRLTGNGKLIEGIFQGETINTPSLLCVEDALDGLEWAEQIGGLPSLIERSQANLEAIVRWVARAGWVDFLARDATTRSCTSVCLMITDPWFEKLPPAARSTTVNSVVHLLEAEGVAYDVAAYREAPPGLRLWAGATVERGDLEALFPWLDWAWEEVKRAEGAAA